MASSLRLFDRLPLLLRRALSFVRHILCVRARSLALRRPLCPPSQAARAAVLELPRRNPPVCRRRRHRRSPPNNTSPLFSPKTQEEKEKYPASSMNAFGGMFAAAVGYQDPYHRMAALQDPSMHHHHHTHVAAAAAHHNHHHHGYKVPRVYFKIPRVLPYKEQKEKFESDDFFKKLAREAEVRERERVAISTKMSWTFLESSLTASLHSFVALDDSYLYETYCSHCELVVIHPQRHCYHQVRYTGYRDRPLHERQAKFQQGLRDGNVEIVSSSRERPALE